MGFLASGMKNSVSFHDLTKSPGLSVAFSVTFSWGATGMLSPTM